MSWNKIILIQITNNTVSLNLNMITAKQEWELQSFNNNLCLSIEPAKFYSK